MCYVIAVRGRRAFVWGFVDGAPGQSAALRSALGFRRRRAGGDRDLTAAAASWATKAEATPERGIRERSDGS